MFFCGAGISYPAGLPGFKGLVDAIYRLVGTTPNAIEQEAYERNQFDATLDLLERRLPGQRLAVRTALLKALQPKLRRKGATDTHAALLQLARSREGALRLVTTNFDRIFARVTARKSQPCQPTQRRCFRSRKTAAGTGWYICTVCCRSTRTIARCTAWCSPAATLGWPT